MTTATDAPATRLEQARRALAEKRAELERISQLITDSFEAEDKARDAALLASPMKGSEQVGGLVSKIRTQRGRNETKVAALARDSASLERVIAELEQGALEETLAEVIGLARENAETELQAWRVFCERLVALHVAWAEVLLPAMQQRDSFRVATEAKHRQLKDSEAWRLAVEAPVVPSPVDFEAAVEQTWAVAGDPYGKGYREAGGARADDQGTLVGLLPDLRAVNRAAILSGLTQTRASSTFFARGFQPVGSSGLEIVRQPREDGLKPWNR